ncbi:2-oxoacid:ferredoxin oxidoreductase subunit beta, partial [Candidatus Bathyarchaeota archaeon]|nr:2-oxoacid:ferredoxin oxidoreductase subunit beta [Candidatus Bathyarchaeota archaeon]
VSQCPTAFGRRVGLKTAKELLLWFKDNSVPLQEAKGIAKKELAGKIVVGEFACRELPTLYETLHEALKEAKNNA